MIKVTVVMDDEPPIVIEQVDKMPISEGDVITFSGPDESVPVDMVDVKFVILELSHDR